MPTYVGRPAGAVHIFEFDSESDELNRGEYESPGLGADDFRNLFLGEPGETAAEAASREEVAREVFAELMDEGADDEITRLNAAYAAWLLCSVSLRVCAVPLRCAHSGAGDASRMRSGTGDVSGIGEAA